MPVSYITAAANARLVAGLTATGLPGQSVDGNTGFGTLVLGTSALSGATGVLATITLPKPSFTISNKVATLAGVPLSGTVTGAGTQTVAKAEIRDSAGNAIVTGLTVGTSASDIIVPSTSLANGTTVTVSSGTITHP